MSEEQITAMKADPPIFLFEYMSKAGPRAINGFPIFDSFFQVSKEEYELVKKYYDELKAWEQQGEVENAL
jgi:hypothetical protein